MGRVSVFDDTHFSSFQGMALDLLINGTSKGHFEVNSIEINGMTGEEMLSS